MDFIKDFVEESNEMKQKVIDQWKEIIECIDELGNYSTDEINRFLNSVTESEKQDLRDRFKESFTGIPDDNAFKLEVLSVLGKLGVQIDVDEDDKDVIVDIYTDEDDDINNQLCYFHNIEVDDYTSDSIDDEIKNVITEIESFSNQL
jgi:hypothetical protein